MSPPALPTADSPRGVATTAPSEPGNTTQASTTVAAELQEDDEDYNSEEDSDFDVDAPTADEEEEEEEGDEEAVDADRPRKRRKISPDADDGDVIMDAEFDSGDEAMIQRGKEKLERAKKRKEEAEGKKRKKGGNKKGVEEDEDEGDDFEIDDDEAGGEGGFVRTRAMKLRLQEEQRPLARADGATVDVDALWEQMNTAKPSPIPPRPISTETSDENTPSNDNQGDGLTKGFAQKEAQVPPGEETITIKRVYKFAGEVITEEKTVPKDSAEAKLYLSSEEAKKKKKVSSMNGEDVSNDSSDAVKIPLRRPLRRYSRFDPNPPDMIKKSWEKKVVAPGAAGVGAAEQPKGPKLNTVMKSKLDWAEYVDRTGIKDDLDVHSKAKEGYLSRMDFLNRVDANREEERRNARLKNL
ncbi:hypothetical protein AJ79_09657 [Helicocarpus griseus UAMH5409]|uniref:SWR1-complex protein 5 n=1 Tax=Helicocarpus griseus UAMH5409 TaxID=1447875 RepID=A0A2B7WHQ0_9EURO|nr:hypothetical protein AJ79_09657 [Helicocarpus griseus UAMH5409]